jgi:DNA-binding transcriptional ArsR family regulator
MHDSHPSIRLPESSLAGFCDESGKLARASGILGLLANESRILILQVLLTVYPASLSAGELAMELSIAAPVLAIHLDYLAAGALVLLADKNSRYVANVPFISNLVRDLFPNLAALTAGQPDATATPPSTPAVLPGG